MENNVSSYDLLEKKLKVKYNVMTIDEVLTAQDKILSGYITPLYYKTKPLKEPLANKHRSKHKNWRSREEKRKIVLEYKLNWQKQNRKKKRAKMASIAKYLRKKKITNAS